MVSEGGSVRAFTSEEALEAARAHSVAASRLKMEWESDGNETLMVLSDEHSRTATTLRDYAEQLTRLAEIAQIIEYCRRRTNGRIDVEMFSDSDIVRIDQLAKGTVGRVLSAAPSPEGKEPK